MRERLAAIEKLKTHAHAASAEPSWSLLNDSADLEIGLLEVLNEKIDARKLRRLQWPEVSELVHCTRRPETKNASVIELQQQQIEQQ
jgi:hypothetical protein